MGTSVKELTSSHISEIVYFGLQLQIIYMYGDRVTVSNIRPQSWVAN